MADEEVEDGFVLVRYSGPMNVNEQQCELCHTLLPPLFMPCLSHNDIYHGQCLQQICHRQQNVRCAKCRADYRMVFPIYESISTHMMGVADFLASKVPLMALSYWMNLDPITNAAIQLGLWNARSFIDLLRQHSLLRRYVPQAEPAFSIFRRQMVGVLVIGEPVVRVPANYDADLYAVPLDESLMRIS